jgi:hypothetical protein
MTNTNPLSTRGDDYPPSRPGLKTLAGLTAVILIGVAVRFWPAISSFIHFPQIQDAFGL